MTTKDPQSLRNTLSAAAESVHLANYQTMPHEGAPGLESPADVYDAIGNLRQLAQYLPRLLGHLQDFTLGEYAAGKVALAMAGDAGPAVMEQSAGLQDAASAALSLESALSRAHGAGTWLKAAR
jgi:hypothetical protein